MTQRGRMMPSFRMTAIVASAICFMLAFVWLMAPHIMLALWKINAAPATLVTARRMAPLFLGIGFLLFCARDISEPAARAAIALGLTIACGGLAVLGVFELAAHNIGPGIILAVLVEAALAAAFARHTRRAN
ncbi:MAG: hypothetical protein KGL46_05435 [Hyphomicrobiales bacterium]|nr:hypothetical protein [Hyphomicrobiales bacterium]